MQAMRRGDFAAAWEETDRIERKRRARERAGRLEWREHHLLWNGQPFSGRRVLIRCNHGLGDTLQFLRFIPWVCAIARAVTLLVQPALLPLLHGTRQFGEVRNGWSGGPIPPHDIEIEIMELAYAFRCTAQTLPSQVPYLPLELIRRGPPPLPRVSESGREYRVGLLWAASDWDPRRSIPLRMFNALCPLTGVRFYSLQQGAHAAEQADSRLPLHPLGAATGDIAQAARAMLHLDLILTVDSMPAHLAGALGQNVWLLLRHHADWRWQEQRADSPWYPTMRLFRQPQPDAWEPVLENVAAALGKTRAGNCSNSVPKL